MADSSFFDSLFQPATRNTTPAYDLASGVLGIGLGMNAANRSSGALAPNSFDQQYQQLSQQLQALTGQLADSNNPEFQQRVKSKTDQIMQSYEQAIRSQQAREANRYGRTGMGLINPERRDEGLARSLAQGRVQAEAQARAEVTNEMLQAARATTLGAGVAGSGANQQRARQAGSANTRNAYNQAIGTGALQIAGALGKGVDFKKLLGSSVVNELPDASRMAGPFGGFDNQAIAGADFTGGMGTPAFDPSAFGPAFDSGAFNPGWTPPPVVDIPYTNQPGFDVGNIGAEWDMPAFEYPAFDMFTQPDFTAGYY